MKKYALFLGLIFLYQSLFSQTWERINLPAIPIQNVQYFKGKLFDFYSFSTSNYAESTDEGNTWQYKKMVADGRKLSYLGQTENRIYASAYEHSFDSLDTNNVLRYAFRNTGYNLVAKGDTILANFGQTRSYDNGQTWQHSFDLLGDVYILEQSFGVNDKFNKTWRMSNNLTDWQNIPFYADFSF